MIHPIGKRVLDIAGAGTGLLVFGIPMMVIALVAWCVQGVPVIFKQVRPGLKGNPFVLYKFRTMANRVDDQGRPLPDGERLTRVGKFLRSTSLDELPELYNVLKGDMSLVGPRPLLMQYLDRYSAAQARRHDVQPGVTGWAQVNGRNALSWEDKFALDLWYVDHQSLWLDIRIIGMTVWKLIRRDGINQPGQATMGEFLGSGGRQTP
jgi:sugar transferase EpsL